MHIFIIFLLMISTNTYSLSIEEAKEIFNTPKVKKDYSFQMGYTMTYDDNTNLSATTVDQNTDVINSVFGKYSWNKSLEKDKKIALSVYVKANKYQTYNELNTTIHQYAFNFLTKKNKDQWQFPISYTGVIYDHRNFADIYTIKPTFSTQLAPNLSLRTYYKYTNNNYDLDDTTASQNDSSGVSNLAGVDLNSKHLNNQLKLKTTLATEKVDAKGSNWDKDSLQTTFNVNYKLNDVLSAIGSFSYKEDKYSNVDSTKNIKKRDTIKKSTFGFNYKIDDNYKIDIKKVITTKSSNVSGYSKNSLEFTLNRKF